MRYKVDLRALMANCEANYRRLQQLLAMIDESDGDRCILLDDHDAGVTFRVREQTPYTCLIEMRAESNVDAPAWLPMPSLLVRMYHDAKMAEVVSFSGNHRVYPRYAYPNSQMFHSDEKAQWNVFLSDWLRYCLRHGLAGQSVLI